MTFGDKRLLLSGRADSGGHCLYIMMSNRVVRLERLCICSVSVDVGSVSPCCITEQFGTSWQDPNPNKALFDSEAIDGQDMDSWKGELIFYLSLEFICKVLTAIEGCNAIFMYSMVQDASQIIKSCINTCQKRIWVVYIFAYRFYKI